MAVQLNRIYSDMFCKEVINILYLNKERQEEICCDVFYVING